jgi:hypothetical protein
MATETSTGFGNDGTLPQSELCSNFLVRIVYSPISSSSDPSLEFMSLQVAVVRVEEADAEGKRSPMIAIDPWWPSGDDECFSSVSLAPGTLCCSDWRMSHRKSLSLGVTRSGRFGFVIPGRGHQNRSSPASPRSRTGDVLGASTSATHGNCSASDEARGPGPFMSVLIPRSVSIAPPYAAQAAHRTAAGESSFRSPMSTAGSTSPMFPLSNMSLVDGPSPSFFGSGSFAMKLGPSEAADKKKKKKKKNTNRRIPGGSLGAKIEEGVAFSEEEASDASSGDEADNMEDDDDSGFTFDFNRQSTMVMPSDPKKSNTKVMLPALPLITTAEEVLSEGSTFNALGGKMPMLDPVLPLPRRSVILQPSPWTTCVQKVEGSFSNWGDLLPLFFTQKPGVTASSFAHWASKTGSQKLSGEAKHFVAIVGDSRGLFLVSPGKDPMLYISPSSSTAPLYADAAGVAALDRGVYDVLLSGLVHCGALPHAAPSSAASSKLLQDISSRLVLLPSQRITSTVEVSVAARKKSRNSAEEATPPPRTVIRELLFPRAASAVTADSLGDVEAVAGAATTVESRFVFDTHPNWAEPAELLATGSASHGKKPRRRGK